MAWMRQCPLLCGELKRIKKLHLVAAGTLTYERDSLCGAPAHSVGWRDPGYFHTGFLMDIWPNIQYFYKVGHKLTNGTFDWGDESSFRGPPFPGQNSLQRVVIFGDLGKAERDGSNEYSNYQPGSLNTTDRLIEDLDNIDIIFHIGDLCYANGYLSQWDQFTELVGPLSSNVPYMVASGNHERDWPGSGSFYKNTDSGGECGVVAETMFYMPTKNRAKFWYLLSTKTVEKILMRTANVKDLAFHFSFYIVAIFLAFNSCDMMGFLSYLTELFFRKKKKE